jgi:hypothetical protein
VQKQVDKVKDAGRMAAMALPTALWDGAVKITRAASSRGQDSRTQDPVRDRDGS